MKRSVFFLGALLSQVVAAQNSAETISTASAERTPTRPFRLEAKFDLPWAAFNLQPANAGNDPLIYTATFTPRVSPVLELGMRFQGLGFSYARKILPDTHFQTFRFDLPWQNWTLRAAYQDFGDFSQQSGWQANGGENARLVYDSSKQSFARPDARYRSAELALEGAWSVTDVLPIDPAQMEKLEMRFLAAGDFEYQRFSADTPFVASVDQAHFSDGRRLSGLTHAGLGVSGGLEANYPFTPQDEGRVTGRGGLRFFTGEARFVDASEKALSLSPFLVTTLGWQHRAAQHRYGFEFGFASNSVQIQEIKLSAFEFFLGTHYSYAF